MEASGGKRSGPWHKEGWSVDCNGQGSSRHNQAGQPDTG